MRSIFGKPVNSWNEEVDRERPSNAFTFAYVSLLLEFYEKRFTWTNATGLDYQLVKKLIDDSSGTLFNHLISFVFSVNSQAAFNLAFGQVISKQIPEAKFLDQAQAESFFSMYAFILIRIHYLLTLIKEEDISTPVNTEKTMKEVLLYIKKNYALNFLQLAIHKTVKKYNNLITMENNLINKNTHKKTVYKSKRDCGRSLIRLIEQNS